MPQGRVAQLCLQRAALVTGLREPGRHDHDGPHAGGAALVDHPHRDASRNDDHREVDTLRQLADRREARPAPDLVVLRVDRIQLAVEPDVAERTLDLGRPAVGRLGRADDRDRPRRQQRPEVPAFRTQRVTALPEPRVPPRDRGLQPLILRDPAELVARGQVGGLDHHVQLGVRRHRRAEPGHVPRPVHRALRRLHDERLVLRDLLGERQGGGVQLVRAARRG